MKVISSEIGRVANLTQAIDAVIPWRKAFRVVKQPFEGDFTIVEAPGWLCRTLPLREPFQRTTTSRAVGGEPALRDLLWGRVPVQARHHSRRGAGVVVDETEWRLASDRVGGPVVMTASGSRSSRPAGGTCAAGTMLRVCRRTNHPHPRFGAGKRSKRSFSNDNGFRHRKHSTSHLMHCGRSTASLILRPSRGRVSIPNPSVTTVSVWLRMLIETWCLQESPASKYRIYPIPHLKLHGVPSAILILGSPGAVSNHERCRQTDRGTRGGRDP